MPNERSPRLKVAFLVHTFPRRSETFVWRKIDFLLSRGHDVQIFCHHLARDDWQPRYEGRVHRLPSNAMLNRYGPVVLLSHLSRLLAGRSTIQDLRNATRRMHRSESGRLRCLANIGFILRTSWDVIHIHFLNEVAAFTGIRDLTKSPVLVSAYGADVTIKPFEEKNGLDDLINQVEEVDAITVSSQYLLRCLTGMVSIHCPVHILYPDIPSDHFRAHQRIKPRTPLRLLTVARLHWTKGLPYGLQAVRRLVDTDLPVQYRIVGEGPAREEISYAVRQLGLERNVTLIGAADPAMVADSMEWADLYVQPSVREDFGAALVEAQASGLPVIASDVGGVREAVSVGVTALVFTPRDASELAYRIRALVGDPALYASLSAAGPGFARNFHSEEIGEQLLEIYRSLPARHGRTGPVERTRGW